MVVLVTSLVAVLLCRHAVFGDVGQDQGGHRAGLQRGRAAGAFIAIVLSAPRRDAARKLIHHHLLLVDPALQVLENPALLANTRPGGAGAAAAAGRATLTDPGDRGADRNAGRCC